jgi:hypothetical protein
VQQAVNQLGSYAQQQAGPQAAGPDGSDQQPPRPDNGQGEVVEGEFREE